VAAADPELVETFGLDARSVVVLVSTESISANPIPIDIDIDIDIDGASS
jgi:hypothetical protein